jgi:hypothetical protein
MCPRRRSALIRAARFFAVLIALLLPWPGLGRAYVATFSRIGTALVTPLLRSPDVVIWLEASPENDEHHRWYAMVSVRDALSQAHIHRGSVDLRRSGYLQVATLLALAAAFPLRRRVHWAVAVAVGTVFLVNFGWLPVLVYLAKKYVIHLGSVAFAALAIVERSLVGAPGMVFFVPAALWLLAVRVVDPAPSRPARAPTATRPVVKM